MHAGRGQESGGSGPSAEKGWPAARGRWVGAVPDANLATVLDPDSLERVVPDTVRAGDATGEESLRLSLERYAFAATHACSGRILDIASGSGYGTHLLAERAGETVDVLGVDLSQEAVRYASERYGGERVRFIAADAMDFADDDGFDAIVSIETIEHLPEPGAFLARIIRLLRPTGVLIGSVPVTPSVDANPYHLHDFSERSFRRLVSHHGLIEVDHMRQVQPFEIGAVLQRSEVRMKHLRPSLPSYYLSHPGAAARRCWSTLRYGFVNRYLTVAWRAPG